MLLNLTKSAPTPFERKKKYIAQMAKTALAYPIHDVEAPKLTPFLDLNMYTKLRKNSKLKHRFVPSAIQKKGMNMIRSGKSLVIVGGAGTGKTTMTAEALRPLITQAPAMWVRREDYYISKGINPDHKYLKPGIPGVVVTSFTNRATQNFGFIMKCKLVYAYDGWEKDSTGKQSKRHIETVVDPFDMCLTIHKFLQYMPVRGEVLGADGEPVSSMKFEPTRDSSNRICPNFKVVVFDEAGMVVANPLFNQFMEACEGLDIQVIILGDLSQLVSIGGVSLLALGLLKLPVVALEDTYRFGGAILDFVTRIRTKTYELPPPSERTKPNLMVYGEKATPDNPHPHKVILMLFDKVQSASDIQGVNFVVDTVFNLIRKNRFHLGLDIFIVPQRVKTIGGANIVSKIFNLLDILYKRNTYLFSYGQGREVIAVGDSILFSKEPHVILGIFHNPNYTGESPQAPCALHTRDSELWEKAYHAHRGSDILDDMNKLIDNEIRAASSNTVDGLIQAASELSEEVGEYTERQPRGTSHSLLILEISGLVKEFAKNYEEKDAYDIALRFLEDLRVSCLVHDSSLANSRSDITHQKQVMTSVIVVAKHYNIVEYVTASMAVKDVSSQFSDFQFGWMTAYQCQGAESQTCINVMHPAIRSTLTTNETLYTGFSRAKRNLLVFISPSLLDSKHPKLGVTFQMIPGITVAQKIQYIKAKFEEEGISPKVQEALKHLEHIASISEGREEGWMTNQVEQSKAKPEITAEVKTKYLESQDEIPF